MIRNDTDYGEACGKDDDYDYHGGDGEDGGDRAAVTLDKQTVKVVDKLTRQQNSDHD